MAKPDSQWYRLDNAGILYSALQREEYSAIYRFSALMTEPVRPAALQNAIDRVLPRFPSFAVRIRRGLFWYYLEPTLASRCASGRTTAGWCGFTTTGTASLWRCSTPCPTGPGP